MICKYEESLGQSKLQRWKGARGGHNSIAFIHMQELRKRPHVATSNGEYKVAIERSTYAQGLLLNLICYPTSSRWQALILRKELK